MSFRMCVQLDPGRLSNVRAIWCFVSTSLTQWVKGWIWIPRQRTVLSALRAMVGLQLPMIPKGGSGHGNRARWQWSHESPTWSKLHNLHRVNGFMISQFQMLLMGEMMQHGSKMASTTNFPAMTAMTIQFKTPQELVQQGLRVAGRGSLCPRTTGAALWRSLLGDAHCCPLRLWLIPYTVHIYILIYI